MNENQRGKKVFTFVMGLLSAAALVAKFFLPDHPGQLLFSLFVLLPIILVFGFVSLFSGLRIQSGGLLSWWMLPASATLTVVLLYVLVTLVWGTLST